jgi:hypothetical protein
LEYQQSWEWVRGNLHAPLPAVLYVSAVSVGVGTKNAFSAYKHDVFVERRPKAVDLAQDTTICLPRICITRRGDLTSVIASILQQRMMTKAAE